MKINSNTIIKSTVSYDDDIPLVSQYSSYNYLSKSFLIRYNAYLPFIESLKEVEFDNSSQVLDLGCADGPFLPTLSFHANKAIGIEFDNLFVKQSRLMIKSHGKSIRNVYVLQTDGHKLPFRESIFDTIFCLEVLEHVKLPLQIIREISRILKKDGTLICTLPVEIGLSLLIRTIIGKILKYKRPKYTIKQLFRSSILKKPGERLDHMEHENFDWRLIKRFLESVFKSIKIKFIPLHQLKHINPLVLIKCKK